jgi:uncharacterized protein involved in outer membrane biogenesis
MSIKKTIRFIFIFIGLLFVLFLGAAIIIPVFYKDKILAEVKAALNENLDAKTDFKDISLSLFRHFPNLSVRIHGLCITGKETFSKDTLISAQETDLSLDIKKAIKGEYDILNVTVVKPRIHAVVHKNGAANWNIVKPTTEKTTSTGKPKHFSISLRKYTIEHAFIAYNDDQMNMRATIEDLTHSGSGEFKSDLFTLKTQTSCAALTVVSGKIPYLSKVKTNISFEIEVDSKNNKYSFDTKGIKLNGLDVTAKGFVQMRDTTNTDVDITFNMPSDDFKDLFSLIPGVYNDNFKDLKTTGKASMSGTVKGVLNKQRIPTFNIAVNIQDGSLQYASLPQKISNVQLKLIASNPDGIPDHTVINLEKGHLDIGPEPFDFNIMLKTPVSNKWVEASAKGRIDLSQMNSFVKLDEGTKLTGIINANVAVKGAIADAEKRQFDSLDATGTITVDNLNFSSKEYPEIAQLSSMALTFNPENITVSNLKAKYLNTQFSGEGSINNLLGYYLHKGILTGSIHLTADKIDGNKWKETFTKPKAKPVAPEPVAEPFAAPSSMNISFNAEIDEIEYDHVKIKNVQGLMVLGDEIINVQNVQAHALEGEVKINGHYSTRQSKIKPEMDFEYIVALGRVVVMRRHIDHL